MVDFRKQIDITLKFKFFYDHLTEYKEKKISIIID